MSRQSLIILAVVLSGALSAGKSALAERGRQWRRHTIDDSSRGADGVRLADVNRDSLPDVTTGWEEGDVIRAYLNPGPAKSREMWPAVTVGRVRSPEDAVFVDLDADGATDVVSSCEGHTRTMFVHWAPQDVSRYLDPLAWKTDPLPASKDAQAWMFCLPLQVDGRHGIDLVAGSKGRGASIGWFEAPENPRRLANWTFHPIYKAGWIMSLAAVDVDGDGDRDILTTDRKGKNRGCHWLENPGPQRAAAGEPWPVHTIGGAGREMMFMACADLDDDGRLDVVSAVRDAGPFFFRRTAGSTPAWETHTIPVPVDIGTGKAVGVADVDLDGDRDLLLTFEMAGGKSGAIWLARDASRPAGDPAAWTPREISGKGRGEGAKFDRIELLDLDADGDFDLLTCEERDNLGVIWYENPTRPGRDERVTRSPGDKATESTE